MYKYEFTLRSKKQLGKLDKKLQMRIIEKIEYCCADNPRLFARKLTDSRLGEYRLRVGGYRVVFDIEDSILVVVAVGDRKEIYR